MLRLDWWLLLLVLIVGFSFILVSLKFPREKKRLYYSDISYFKSLPKTWKVRLVNLPRLLKASALVMFLIAFVDPQIMIPLPADHENIDNEEKEESIPLPREGRAIYLLLDRSGSMEELMYFVDAKGKRRRMTRLDVLKQVTANFVAGNKNLHLKGRFDDLVGLVAFARVANIEVPLTLDHNTVLDKLSKISTARTLQDNGTAIGYALFKTINLIKATKHFSQEIVEEGKPSYDITSTVIVLVTDGIQETNPADEGHQYRAMSIDEAVKYASDAGIRIYVVNINPDIQHMQFARAKRELQTIADKTGGKFYVASDPSALCGVYADIDALETDALPQEDIVQAKVIEIEDNDDQYRPIVLYPYFVGSGLVCLLLAIVLSTTWLRRIP